MFNIWISNVPKTGEVNAAKIGAVNKLTFEPINSARSGREPNFRLSGRGLRFQLSPKLGRAVAGRNFGLVNIGASHLHNPENSKKFEQKKTGEHSPPALWENGNGPKVQPVKYRLQLTWVRCERMA